MLKQSDAKCSICKQFLVKEFLRRVLILDSNAEISRWDAVLVSWKNQESEAFPKGEFWVCDKCYNNETMFAHTIPPPRLDGQKECLVGLTPLETFTLLNSECNKVQVSNGVTKDSERLSNQQKEVTLYIPVEHYNLLEEYAKEEGKSKSEVVKELIQVCLNKRK